VEAREKVEAEMDLAEMIQAVRMTKFLRQLNDDKGYFNPLIAYSFRYRVNAPGFPQKEQDAKMIADNSVADALTGSTELQKTLTHRINGSMVGRVETLV